MASNINLTSDSPANSFFEKEDLSDEQYQQLAEYANQYFEIISDNFADQPLWLILKYTRVVLFGEDHDLKERENIASIINRLWNQATDHLLTEHEGRLTIGQLEYVDDEITKQAETWDFSTEEKNYLPSQMMYNSAFYIARQTVCTLDATDDVTLFQRFDELFKTLGSLVPSEMLDPLKNEVSSLYAYTYTANAYPSEFKEKHLHLMTRTCRCALNLITHYLANANKTELDECIKREEKFKSEIHNRLAEEDKRVFAIAGCSHLQQDKAVISSLKEKSIPYLVLFGKQVHQRETIANASETWIDWSGISLEEKRKTILQFDGVHIPKKLHYYPEITLDVLESDLDSLIKEASNTKQGTPQMVYAEISSSSSSNVSV